MKRKTEKIFLGFGGNLNNAINTILCSIQRVNEFEGIDLVQSSPLYRTEPLYDKEQPEFINAVAEFATDKPPHEILSIVHDIEKEFGRYRDTARRYGPRSLDIDILFWGDRLINDSGLTVPHKEFSRRKFVLEPMGEIALNYRVPGTDKTIRDFINECPDQSKVEKI